MRDEGWDRWRVDSRPSAAMPTGEVGARRVRRSEWRVLFRPQLVLSWVRGLVIAPDLVGVAVFERAGEFVEELEELCCGFIGELAGQKNEGWMVRLHDGGTSYWFRG